MRVRLSFEIGNLDSPNLFIIGPNDLAALPVRRVHSGFHIIISRLGRYQVSGLKSYSD
jgi:hypothetical protein